MATLNPQYMQTAVAQQNPLRPNIAKFMTSHISVWIGFLWFAYEVKLQLMFDIRKNKI